MNYRSGRGGLVAAWAKKVNAEFAAMQPKEQEAVLHTVQVMNDKLNQIAQRKEAQNASLCNDDEE